MQPFGKRGFTAGAVTLALGLAAFGGSLVTASSALANAPGGTACNPTDGKIDGWGSSYQANAETLWFNAYNSEICGNVTAEGSSDPTPVNMGDYNYPTAASASLTGSGNGLKGANCRTEDYWGSDTPYNEAQLTALDGAAGNTTQSSLVPTGGCSAISLTVPPFAPNSSTNTTFPNASDATANLMAFPIGGSAEGVAVNLTNTQCTGTGGAPTSIDLTGAQLSAIMGGSIAKWNDPSLTTNNPGLAACNFPITRVVRQDTSGTTHIFMTYLQDVDNSRTGATCAAGTTWASYNGSVNNVWPSGTGCSTLAPGASSGGPAQLAVLNSTPGGIAYADLSDVVNLTGADIQVAMQNGAGTAYVSAANGLGANCDLSALSEPGGGASTAMVGLVSTDNWGSDNATVNGTGNHDDANNIGTVYPICGLTYALVYSGLHGAAGTGAVSQMTVDQRRTLYSYMTFVLSSLGQSILPNNNYASLPATWQPAVLAGFQKNF